MVLTVGTLSVPKDTQGPAGPHLQAPLLDNAPVLELLGPPRLPRMDHVCRGRYKATAQCTERLFKTSDINKCDLSIQEIQDAVVGAAGNTEDKTDVLST